MGTTSNGEVLDHETQTIHTEANPINQFTATGSSADHVEQSLPDAPVVIIKPGQRRTTVNFRELWAYRELLYFLTWRDIKIKYKQTALGVAWVVIQPLFTMLIFSLFFGKLAAIPSDGVPYPLFAYAGLLPWTFFSNAVTTSANSLIGNSNLITKVYFPRMIIPAASVVAGLMDFAIAFLILALLMFYYGVGLTWGILILPITVFLTIVLAIACGTWFSALNVKYRDVRFALPFLIQLWMFISPVIYPTSFLPAKWRWLLTLNPMTGIIEGFRSSLFGLPFNWTAMATSATITLLLLIYSSYVFRSMEKSFADIV